MLARLSAGRRALQRAAPFSTSSSASNARINAQLEQMLQVQASQPVAKALTTTARPQYKIFETGRILLPNSLTHKKVWIDRTPRPRSRAAPVAPPPELTRRTDILYRLGIDPRQFSTNGPLLSHFVTEMGKIKPRDQTLLAAKSQRLLGRTIRRAKMMGLIPYLSKYHGV